MFGIKDANKGAKLQYIVYICIYILIKVEMDIFIWAMACHCTLKVGPRQKRHQLRATALKQNQVLVPQ